MYGKQSVRDCPFLFLIPFIWSERNCASGWKRSDHGRASPAAPSQAALLQARLQPGLQTGAAGWRSPVWRRGVRSGRIGQWKNAQPRVVARYRGAQSRGEVAVSASGGAFREDPGTRPAEDRILVIPEKREGDLYVFLFQRRRRGKWN